LLENSVRPQQKVSLNLFFTVFKKGPPKFKQRAIRTFKSKAPILGQKGTKIIWRRHPGMEGLGTDFSVIWPWEAFGDMELSDLAKYGIL
uniref:Retinal cone rhodopsin-sensitive cGMP 3',5'-cyclic phosphodiesterase subunit gamma n=1 Tax=Mastacembelus armatus TaxID=205130 RepID=A0A7N8XS21_9TELE